MVSFYRKISRLALIDYIFMKMTNPIYNTVDSIEPRIVFHKSVNIDGGIVAKAASIGGNYHKLIVKTGGENEGIYIRMPCNFDDKGIPLTEPMLREYNLGAVIEAVQELNRRTAWMDTGMDLTTSLKGTDVVDNASGTLYSNVNDLLPGLKHAINSPYVHIIDGDGHTLMNIPILSNYDSTSLLGNNEGSTLTGILMNEIIGMIQQTQDVQSTSLTFISPLIAKRTDNSITLYGSTDSNSLTDKWYTYTVEDGICRLSLRANFNNTALPTESAMPIFSSYITDCSNANSINVTSLRALFKDQLWIGNIDVSSWSFVNINDMSYMFAGCANITSIYFGNNNLDNNANRTINTDYIFEGASKLEDVRFYKDAAHPAFVRSGIPETLYISDDDRYATIYTMDENDNKVTYNGLVWNISSDPDDPIYRRFNYTASLNNDPYKILYLEISYTLNTDNNTLTQIKP